MKKNTKKFNLKTREGFTLIETVIYIALFALIMSGTLVSIYGIIGSSIKNQTRAMLESEGSFLIGKMDWYLNGAKSISVEENGNIVSISKFSGENIKVSISEEGIMEVEKEGTTLELSNSNVKVTCPLTLTNKNCFIKTENSDNGIKTESIYVSFILNSLTSDGLPISQNFSTIKYLRK